MPDPTVLDLSRWQFAVTIAFHMTFPAITVGLSIFLAVVYGLHLRTRKPVYLQIFRFWKRIFALGFALGVVSGTVITFEFGLNWGKFAHATGPIIGPIIGMEVVTAFFLEAGFIGIMLYGDGRVSERVMMVSTSLVALGTILSTTWIISANSWMQTPSGYRVVDGQFVPTSWWEAIFSPSFGWRFPHMLLGVLITAAWLVAGIGAYYLRHGRATEFGRRTLSLSLGVVTLLLPAQLWIGDQVAARYVIPDQPAKFQALEGNWDSDNTGYLLFVVPDQQAERNRVEVGVPRLGSWIAKDLSGETATPGLKETPPQLRPDMLTTFYGFRAMFYASMVMFAAAFVGVVLRLRGRLYSSPRYHRFLVWLTPICIVAIIGGWVTAEAGRQPWVVFGEMRTADGVSDIAPGSVVATFAAFTLTYLTLLVVWVVYVVRSVRRGPESDWPDEELGSDGDDPRRDAEVTA